MATQGTSNSDLPGAINAINLQTLTLSDSQLAAQCSTQLLPNFPLPRELRDQIYLYLLHHEYVHDRPYHRRSKDKRGLQFELNDRRDSVSLTYNFHTSILSVNHAINFEASEALQSNNFVIISHKWDRFGLLKHQHDLSVVTENSTHLSRFRLHKLRLHLQTQGKNKKLESFMIVAEQLSNFCAYLQWVLYLFRSPSSYVTHSRGTEPHAFQRSGNPLREDSDDNEDDDSDCEWLVVPSIKIQLQKQVDERTAISTLEPFKQVVFGQLKVKVMKQEDHLQYHSRKLEKLMGPRTIWTNAMAWHMVESLGKRKQQADNFVGRGQLATTGVRYRLMWVVYDQCPIFHFKEGTYNSSSAQPVDILCSIMITAAIMDTLIEISLGEICNQDFAERRLEIIEALESRVHSLPAPERLTTHLPKALVEWHMILCGFITQRSGENLQLLLSAIRKLANDMDTGKLDNDLRDSVEHDLRLMESCVKDQKTYMRYLSSSQSTDKWLCAACSVGHGAMRAYKMAQHDTLKPQGLEDYVDMNHYEQIRAYDPVSAAKLLDIDE